MTTYIIQFIDIEFKSGKKNWKIIFYVIRQSISDNNLV